jgi:hypothetical protein
LKYWKGEYIEQDQAFGTINFNLWFTCLNAPIKSVCNFLF